MARAAARRGRGQQVPGRARRNRPHGSAWLPVSVLFALALLVAAGPAPRGLRCEYAVDPVGLSTLQPRFSWQLTTPGSRQSAWQLQVASSAERLAAGRGDLWDSGRVATAASHLVPYSGRELAAGTTYHWRVRFWDGAAEPSAWSAAATFALAPPPAAPLPALADLPRRGAVTTRDERLNLRLDAAWAAWQADPTAAGLAGAEYGLWLTEGAPALAAWAVELAAAPETAALGALVAWRLYERAGDRRAVAQVYEPAKAAAQALATAAALPPSWPAEPGASPELLAAAYGYHLVVVVAGMADALDHAEDGLAYGALAVQLADAFNARFYQPAAATYDDGRPVALAAALYFGLVPEEDRARVGATLRAAVEAAGAELACGPLGGRLLRRALCETGAADAAYGLPAAAAPDEIDLGVWALEYLAGLRPDHARPGLQHFLIEPHPVAGLDGARAEHESPYGRIVVDWQRAGPLLTLRLAIPPNTRARITLPALPGTLTEAGRGREGVLYGADLAQLELGPGEWELGCRLP